MSVRRSSSSSRHHLPESRVHAALRSLVPILFATTLQAQQFERRELSIPVRDGVKLFAVALVPKSMAKPLPIMLVRTPYNASGNFAADTITAPYKELAQDGYIFVTQDIRGRFKSEGEFILNGALHDPNKDPKGVDEVTDTWDTIEWLVKNLPGNNGRVGVMGVSYPGWLAGLAGVNPHPAVKAISPQAPMTDTWLGDDFFHQGAFRQSFGLEFGSAMEMSKDFSKSITIDRYDRYDWYLQFPTLDSLAKATGVSNLPSWRSFVEHPAWDEYWQGKAMQRVLTKPDVPILTVGGFWDQEDLFGPQESYRVLEPNDRRGINHIVLGPWYHGQWSRPGGDAIGSVKFGDSTSNYYRERIQRPWFAHFLHGAGSASFPEAWVFESGANEWRSFDAWPPKAARARKLYLRENGLLSFDPPKGAGFDAYVSDPKHPIPYVARPVDGTKWRQWMVEDQRFVHNRPDVLSWETPPLAEDVTIAGRVLAKLFASTTGTDADWVVKLIDVYPDTVTDDPGMGGYQLMVSSDVLRGRYRNSFSKAEPIPANVVTPFTVDLHQQLYRFKRGHRIMVQVQSSWFPLYDRNPQTFVPNIFKAKATDFRAREHRIHHAPRYASHIEVGVMP